MPETSMYPAEPNPTKTARAGYREALSWLLLNDDTSFLDEEDEELRDAGSVTVCFAADMYRRSTKTVVADLLALRTKFRKAGDL